jgi:hypothetical protein
VKRKRIKRGREEEGEEEERSKGTTWRQPRHGENMKECKVN